MAHQMPEVTQLSGDSLKYRIYSLLYEFKRKKEQILMPLDLPKYKIPWI
jgi:hypothetical protein